MQLRYAAFSSLRSIGQTVQCPFAFAGGNCTLPSHFTRRTKLSFKSFFPSNLYIKKWTLIRFANGRGLAAALHHARTLQQVGNVELHPLARLLHLVLLPGRFDEELAGRVDVLPAVRWSPSSSFTSTFSKVSWESGPSKGACRPCTGLRRTRAWWIEWLSL